jgi:hypothetical protein
MILEVLTSLADLLIKEGQNVQAIKLLTFSLNHAAGKKETRDRASCLMAELAKILPDRIISTSSEWGKVRQLEGLVQEVLNEKMVENLLVT